MASIGKSATFPDDSKLLRINSPRTLPALRGTGQLISADHASVCPTIQQKLPTATLEFLAMASTGVNVLRWSALAGGLFYGFSHQRAITATQKADHSKHEYEKKQKLIEQAKAEYAKQKNPAPASVDNVITDVNSPQFDLEKFLVKVAKENP